MRCPFGDLPGTGGNRRGVTGPSSSRQRVVPFFRVLVLSETTAVFFERNSGSVLLAHECVCREAHSFSEQDAAHLTVPDLDAAYLRSGRQPVQRPVYWFLLMGFVPGA
jgi:hypothetical protein